MFFASTQLDVRNVEAQPRTSTKRLYLSLAVYRKQCRYQYFQIANRSHYCFTGMLDIRWKCRPQAKWGVLVKQGFMAIRSTLFQEFNRSWPEQCRLWSSAKQPIYPGYWLRISGGKVQQLLVTWSPAISDSTSGPAAGPKAVPKGMASP